MAKLILKTPYYKPGHKTDKGQSRGGYTEYIATREGVEVLRSGYASYIGERRGSHGMFSDEGEDINLSKISAEIDNHNGNVWGFIISLMREDADRLGYNTAEQWMNLIRSHRNDIAREMNISPENLRWCAAYASRSQQLLTRAYTCPRCKRVLFEADVDLHGVIFIRCRRCKRKVGIETQPPIQRIGFV